ncbi:hypothetical protein RA28_16430 [Ruegeria sp. ANG-S4]|uniref:hypothetical protein n=1 Tax=Ruegeria sp. ANG-S4 TaxID=1577904 RepID=UPI00057CC37F|nr:hypothetical protein [Ruegeria sp. ANG-S4]KIC44492.1 hypothetical protein RA28_16430 [Ruegeria sp. ANG-S4]
MTACSYRIPYDLCKELESRPLDEWDGALRAWAKSQGLTLKIQWCRQLQIKEAELHARRYAAKPQDRWMAFKEWLERHDVPAPDKLPQWAEIN